MGDAQVVDTGALPLGDLLIEVACAHQLAGTVVATVFDQTAGTNGGSATATVVALLVLLSGGGPCRGACPAVRPGGASRATVDR